MASITDDFNRADSTNLGASWVEVSGDWSIVANQLSPGTTGTTILLRAATAMASNDHYAQVKIAATTAVTQGVWCRGDNTLTSGYAVRNNGTSWDLFSVVSSTFTNIGTYSAAAAAGDTVKIQAVGSTITVYINGTQRISVTNTAVTTGTTVGIRSQANSTLRYDDFTAADIITGATLPIASNTETAQTLTGAKTTGLSTASETGTAQTLTGTKTAILTPAAETDTAQDVAGAKSSTLGAAGAVQSAQPLTGTKTATFTPAIELDTAQNLSGIKTDALDVASALEAAQPLTGLVAAALGTATAAETALPLTSYKTATLGTALEVDTARPPAALGAHDDITTTVGQPYSRWAVSEPSSQPWPVGTPY